MLSAEERSGLVFTLVGGGALVVVLLFALGVFSDSPPAAVNPDVLAKTSVPALKLGAVRGRVVDGRSGYGLATRMIEVRGLDGLSDHWLLDPDPATPGTFEVRGLPTRACTLALQADGYVEATRALTIEAGKTAELGDVTLVPLVILSGQVIDANGVGLGPAQVQIDVAAAGGATASDPIGARANATAKTIATDGLGGFRIDRLPPATYRLRASSTAGDVSFLDVTIDASGGGEQLPLALEVFPTVALRGVLRMPVGSAPLAGVSAQGRRGEVRGDGRFEVNGLRAGPLRLLVDIDGARGICFDLAAPDDDVELAIDPADAQPLAQLAAERDAATNELAGLEPGPRDGVAIVLRAIDASGRRLAGARIEVVDDATGERARLRFANRAGECVLRGLAPEKSWRLRACFGPLAIEQPLPVSSASTRETIVTLVPPPPPPPPPPSPESGAPPAGGR
jgi:hypothetical protein